MKIFDKINKIKKQHTIASLIIFCVVLIYSFGASNLSLFSDPLSKFSLNQKTSTIWFFCLLLLNYVVSVNTFLTIRNSLIDNKKYLYLCLSISSISLLGLTLFDMSNKILHDVFAAAFFFVYAVTIFLFGFLNIKLEFRTAMTSIVCSVFMLLSTTWLAFNIFSIPEIIYILLCYGWTATNIFHNEWKGFLKKIGF